MSHNVCIYFSDTGGGHRSAADAIENALRVMIAESGNKPEVSIIKDAVAEKCHPVNRRFVEMYNFLLRHHQPLMKYYYWFLHAIKPESGFNVWLTGDFWRRLIQTHEPSVMVSVHPMINHLLANATKVLGLKDKLKLIIVVTDPNADLWKAWACNDADLIVAPSSMVANRLIEFGVDESKIAVLGMPVHPDFLKPSTMQRRAFLSHLGLGAEVPTVCINAGWAGGGNMLKIYKNLSQVKRPIQAIFLCGHNTALYEEAMTAAAESDVPTAVLPFHDCMSDLMSAVDIMVTKAGGLTTFQALARRLPLVFDTLTAPMPQERGTIDMLVEQGLAYSVSQASDIVEIIEAFEPDELREQRELPTAYDLNLTDEAVFEIASRIFEYCNPPILLSPAVEPEVRSCDSLPKSTVNQAAGEI